jgi:hypothetical protein
VGVDTALSEAVATRITLQYLQPSSLIENAHHRKVRAFNALSILSATFIQYHVKRPISQWCLNLPPCGWRYLVQPRFSATSLQAFPTITLGSQHWELKAANSSFTAALTVLNGCLEFSTMPQSMSHIANRSPASMMQGSLQSDDVPDDLECLASGFWNWHFLS